MELKKAIFPKKGDYYLKNIFEKIDESIQVQCGTVFLNKGDELPLKTLEYHEVAYLVSGKLMSYTKEQEYIMNPSDLIYINRKEVRATKTLEDSKIIFFLYKNVT